MFIKQGKIDHNTMQKYYNIYCLFSGIRRTRELSYKKELIQLFPEASKNQIISLLKGVINYK